MFWKIYFYILIALYVPSYFYNFTIGLNRFWEFLDISVTAFCLVGLFGFSWKKGIFSQQFWQSLFWGSIGWFIIYHYFMPIPLQALEHFPPNLSQKVLATIEFIPLVPFYIALFIYAFKRSELWK